MRILLGAVLAVGLLACDKSKPAPPAADPAPAPAPAAAPKRPTPESIKRDVEGAQQRHDEAIDKAFENAGK